MADDKMRACIELTSLFHTLAATVSHEYFDYQFEQLGMQTDAAELQQAISKLQNVVQENRLRLSSKVH